MATMVTNLRVARLKEYLIFTLICFFYFSYAYASSIVAKLVLVVE